MDLEYYQPTPIQKLSEKLNNNSFYIKRDDLILISFGGNKARKAILFFDDLEKCNFNCMVTYGSSSFNHCMVISNVAASKNIPCYIISPSESNKPTFNSEMINLISAKIIECPISEVNINIEKNK